MKSLPYQYLPLLNFFLGMVIWVIDTLIDVHIIGGETGEEEQHEGEESFIDSLLFSEGTELWMRTLVVIVLVAAGFYARNIIHRQKLVEDELLKHKNNLEDLIEQRMGEIKEKNLELEKEVENRKLAEKELERLATTDSLTSLYNRRKTTQLLENEIQRAKRYKHPLTVLLIDIDHFKSINDALGHNKGDEVLVNFARVLFSSVRNTDIVARWGGEEFLIACLSCDLDQAKQLGNNLRRKIAETEFEGISKVTFSAGIAQYNSKDKSLVDFINRADKALYLAKSTGRDRIKKAS